MAAKINTCTQVSQVTFVYIGNTAGGLGQVVNGYVPLDTPNPYPIIVTVAVIRDHMQSSGTS